MDRNLLLLRVMLAGPVCGAGIGVTCCVFVALDPSMMGESGVVSSVVLGCVAGGLFGGFAGFVVGVFTAMLLALVDPP